MVDQDNQPMSQDVDILIVEDSATEAEMLKHLMQDSGYQVAVASNGKEALVKVKSHHPNLIISDIVMPEMDGYTLCRRLKDEETTQDIPVVLMTALSEPQEVIKAVQAKADAFMRKPIREQNFLDRIQDVLSTRSFSKSNAAAMAEKIVFKGEKYAVPSDVGQRVHLLVSAFEEAVQANVELASAELELRTLNNQLEDKVKQRTLALELEVDQRKQVEKELRHKAKNLARRNQDLHAFAYVASHDLKAPLRAINNLSSWIMEDAGEVLPDSSRQHLEKLRQRVMRMEKLMGSLLQYSRAGRINHENQQVDCQTLIREIVDMLAPEDGFRVTIEGKMPVLETDRVPLLQVLMNLIGNAIKHHDRPDGQVKVSARDSGTWVEFRVEDDGPGIPAEFHERIFSMFQTLRPRDEVEGSGMGLAVVKNIVETRGGRIEVASAPACGSTFRFTWPKSQQGEVLNRAG